MSKTYVINTKMKEFSGDWAILTSVFSGDKKGLQNVLKSILEDIKKFDHYFGYFDYDAAKDSVTKIKKKKKREKYLKELKRIKKKDKYAELVFTNIDIAETEDGMALTALTSGGALMAYKIVIEAHAIPSATTENRVDLFKDELFEVAMKGEVING